MRFLFVFGTTEGHTRELCQFMGRTLREAGHTAAIEEAGPDATHPDPTAYDGVVLAASLHVGRYQPALVQYATTHHEVLNAKPSAFVSVSLSAAGVNPHDWEGLEQCLAGFRHDTQWSPKAVCQAPGAILYSRYDFFKGLAIQYIAHRRGEKTVTSRDYDLTDYDALAKFVLEFAQHAASPLPA